MTDERSERLRSVRKRASNKAEEQAENEEVKPDKPDKAPKAEKEESITPVKERDDWGPIQMHLPDDLRDDLELAFDETNLELRKDGEEKLQKLLHYYPLVVSAGIDAIDEMDVGEIEEKAKRFE